MGSCFQGVSRKQEMAPSGQGLAGGTHARQACGISGMDVICISDRCGESQAGVYICVPGRYDVLQAGVAYLRQMWYVPGSCEVYLRQK